MAKDIGRKDLPEMRLILLAITELITRIPWPCLNSGGLADSAQLVRRVGERGKKVGQSLLDSQWPVNACKSTRSCIADDCIEAWEVSEKSSGQRLYRTKRCQINLLRLKRYSMFQGYPNLC